MANLAAVASKLLGRTFENKLIPGTNLAQTGTVNKQSTGAFDVDEGAAEVTVTPVTRSMILLPYSVREIGFSNGLVQVGDVKAMVQLDADLTGVTTNDTITDAGGMTYRIVAVETPAIGTEKLLAKLQCRPV